MKKNLNILVLLCVLVSTISFGKIDIVHATGEGNPRLIIEEYSITDDEIIPGEVFNLNMKIRNTSQFFDVFTVVFSLSDTSDEMVYPVYGESDQIYVDRIYARSSTEVNIQLKAADNITADVIPVEFTVTFNDDHYVEKQYNTTTVYLPVRTAGDLNVISCSVPECVELGTKARVSASYENTGSGKLSNVTMKVSTDDEKKNIDLYNLNGGSENAAEAYLECGSLGEKTVSISFSYENDEGETFETDDFVYKMNVIDNDNNYEVTETTSENTFRMLTIISAAAVIVVVLMIILMIRKKR